jgi:hypothetical protein
MVARERTERGSTSQGPDLGGTDRGRSRDRQRRKRARWSERERRRARAGDGVAYHGERLTSSRRAPGEAAEGTVVGVAGGSAARTGKTLFRETRRLVVELEGLVVGLAGPAQIASRGVRMG